MLMGHAEGLPRLSSTTDVLLSDPVSELDADEEEHARRILHMASFEELSKKYVTYDTIIWASISLFLVLAWGIGAVMLLYLPFKRYVLQKHVTSCKLYVTPEEIVYKVKRPSYIPFWGEIKIEKRVPLSLVIGIIIEQGWLQSMFGIHTFRIESIAHKIAAAPVDVLQIQGVYEPDVLRRVIITEASKAIKKVGRGGRYTFQAVEGEGVARMGYFAGGSSVLRSPSRTYKVPGSPHPTISEHHRVGVSHDVLHKMDEVDKSLKRIESLMEKFNATPGSTAKRNLLSAFGD
ncbi:hypothetical protein LIER_42708 [Lithospermum erythrorhizon]|uniref:DUF7642 domain-containing protein n=1 Tax=Lithospermum erythrorhizon TaxID=34254 RepID=A0AAV3NS50_LITER